MLLCLGLPLFLFGESMGGLLVLLYAAREASFGQISGLVVAGPVVKVAAAVTPPWPLLTVLRLLSKVNPK